VGLRETKKVKMMQTVQREALHLFADQGYEPTTVEQITAAAEVSTTTFYRYFSSKEDVVLYGGRSPVIDEVLEGRPDEESLPDAIRNALVAAVVDSVGSDREDVLARLQLIFRVPSLRAAFSVQSQQNLDTFAGVLARRIGRTGEAGDSYLPRLAAALVISSVNETIRYWADHDGEPVLADLVGQAVEAIRPVLEALDAEAAALREAEAGIEAGITV